MALLFMDGFGSNETTAKWDPSSAAYTSQSSTPRVAGCFYGYGDNPLIKSFTPSATDYVGFGLRMIDTIATTASLAFRGDAGATAHINVVRNPTSNVLEIRLGGTSGTLLASGT